MRIALLDIFSKYSALEHSFVISTVVDYNENRGEELLEHSFVISTVVDVGFHC